jgi:HD-like signal output (HDOD) protein/ActR/RegA family two-component response regulator
MTESPPLAGDRRRILIADDEEPIRRMLTRFLSARYDVRTASGGVEAVKVAIKDRPDLLLLDLEMQDIHGLEVIKALRSNPEMRTLPIIVLTGLSTKENVVKAIQAGASDFVVKGRFSLSDLGQRIVKLLVRAPEAPRTEAPAAKPEAPKGTRAPAASKDARFPAKEEIERRLRESIDLKALPAVISEVIRSTSDPSADAAVLTEIVSRDPSISARVLHVANSAFYVMEGRVQHLSQAITRLGFRQVRDLTIALKLVEEYSGASRTDEVRQELWRHAIGCAVLARNLSTALKCTPEETESAFMGGLLHDVGQAFLLDAFPKPYEKLLAAAQRKGLSILEQERAALGLDHVEITRRLLEKWNLLQELGPVVLPHHADASGGTAPRAASILSLADVLTRAAGIGSDGETALPQVVELTEKLPGLTRETAGQVLSDVEHQVDQMSAVLQLRHETPKKAPAAGRALPAEAVWTAELSPPADPVELFLRRHGCALRDAATLADGVAGGAPAAAFLRAHSQAWLQAQVDGLLHKGLKWSAPERPLVVLSEVAPSSALKAGLKKLGARVLVGGVGIPELLKTVKPSRR